MPSSEQGRPGRVTLTVGKTQIAAALNDTVTARAFRKLLPFTVSLSRFEHDYCGNAATLDTDKSQLRDGWTNGDIGYGGGYFSILFGGQEVSNQYKGMMIIGHVDEEHLDAVRQLGGSIVVTVALA